MVRRVPTHEYGWDLYDSATYTDGLHAVYKHRTGAWLAIAPQTQTGYEIALFDAEGHGKTRTDAECLIGLLRDSQYALHGATVALVQRFEGGAKDAYAFAELEDEVSTNR